jgi:hypothetical protein
LTQVPAHASGVPAGQTHCLEALQLAPSAQRSPQSAQLSAVPRAVQVLLQALVFCGQKHSLFTQKPPSLGQLRVHDPQRAALSVRLTQPTPAQ